MATRRGIGAHFRSLVATFTWCSMTTLASPAHAEQPSIWYRASEGCPDGPSFLERLEQRGLSARLAAVGDQVDFVVTLGPGGAGSSGRLERQTNEGTIAIRQVEAEHCGAVADALAFSLALTHDPSRETASEMPAPTPAAATPTPVDRPPQSASQPSRPRSRPAIQPPAATPITADAPSSLALGVSLVAWEIFDGPWLLGAGPFIELEAPASFALSRATMRGSLVGSLRGDGGAGTQVWLGTARLEGCPAAVTGGPLALRPCVAFDTGAVGASARGSADTAWWSGLAAHVRLGLELERLVLETQAGAVIPLTRYEISTAKSSIVLEKTRSIGFAAGLGASVRLE